MSTAPKTAPPPEEEAPRPAAPPAALLPAPQQRSFWPFLIALSFVVALAELAFIIVNVSSLPVYLEFGLRQPGWVGLGMGAFYAAEAAGNPLMGGLSDRYGRRRMMVLGALISMTTCLATAGLGYVDAGMRARGVAMEGATLFGLMAAILVLRVLDGFAAAMLWPAVFASVGDRVDEKSQGLAMSALNITYMAGIAVGPFIGGFSNDILGSGLGKDDARRYVPSFVVGAACFLLAAVIAFIVAPRRVVHPLPEQQRHAEEAHEETVGEIAQAAHPPVGLETLKVAWRKVPILMGIGFLVFCGVGLIGPHAKPYFMDRFGLSESGFGTLLLWPAVVVGIAAAPLGKLTDRWGKTRSIHLGMGVCAASLWPILFLTQESAVVILGSLLGIGFVLAFPAYMAYLNDISRPEERGGLIGAIRMAQGIGAGAGALLASPLYTRDEKHMTLFCTAGALLTLSFLLSLFFVRERPKAAAAEAA
jgi:MFS family permease